MELITVLLLKQKFCRRPIYQFLSEFCIRSQTSLGQLISIEPKCFCSALRGLALDQVTRMNFIHAHRPFDIIRQSFILCSGGRYLPTKQEESAAEAG